MVARTFFWRGGPLKQAPGAWNLPAWGPRPLWGYPPDPQNCQKKCVVWHFSPGPWNLPAWAPDTLGGTDPLKNPKRRQCSWVWGPDFNGLTVPYRVRCSRVISVPVYREALPSLTVLSRRSAGGLGRSLERPCKWSAALSAV